VILRLKALAAGTGLIAIVVGLPVLLIAIGANPIPATFPTLDSITGALTTPDDGSLLLGVVAAMAWAAWVFLAASILVEVAAAVRGISAPRIPLLRFPQTMVRPLVATAALLMVATPLLASPSATAAPTETSSASPLPVSSLIGANETQTESVAAQEASEALEDAPAVVTHTVKRGESLWGIAEAFLGDGARFREIVDLNQGLLDGHASFIEPGWELQIPSASPAPTNGERQVVAGDTLSQIALEELGDANLYPEIFEASRDIVQTGGGHLIDPDAIDVGDNLEIPAAIGAPPAPSAMSEPAPAPAPAVPDGSAAEPAAPAAETPQAADEQTNAEAGDEASSWPSRTEYGVGALLAAGVITLIAARRRAQQRRRRPGQHIPMPTAETADLEQELRVVADTISFSAVGTALRTLAQNCAQDGSALPRVRAGRLTATQFDLYLDEPAALPAPWTGTADATVWTLQVENTVDLDADSVADVPSPYPALVTIGHDTEGGHVFLDLEYLGALGVIGDDTQTREILTALAVELATSIWADDLQITVVGDCAGLEDALQTGRIRYLPTAGRILEDLEARASADRAALAEDDSPDLNHARVSGAAPDAWMPEIVLLTGPITDRQRNQIDNLVEQLPRVALAAVTSGLAVGEWALQLGAGDEPDLAVLSPIGLQLRPQRIPAEQYTHLLEMAALTGDPPRDSPDVEDISPEPSLAELNAITTEPEVEPDVDETQVEISNPPEPEAETASDTSAADPALLEVEDERAATPDVAAAGLVDEEDSDVQPLPLPAPMILVLGEPDIVHATGTVAPSKRSRRIELAAYLALNPGATRTAIDDAIWPARKTDNNLQTRNTATSNLRKWLGANPAGEDYLPRHQSGAGYGFLPEVRSDVDVWSELLDGGPWKASTENLEAALSLVRGRPFADQASRYYAWAEGLRQRLISEIADASYELTRRRLMDGRWRAAEESVVAGLAVEPVDERLWRMRILAAHESHSADAEREAIEILLTITSRLEFDLEPETVRLLEALKDPRAGLDDLMAEAL